MFCRSYHLNEFKLPQLFVIISYLPVEIPSPVQSLIIIMFVRGISSLVGSASVREAVNVRILWMSNVLTLAHGSIL